MKLQYKALVDSFEENVSFIILIELGKDERSRDSQGQSPRLY